MKNAKTVTQKFDIARIPGWCVAVAMHLGKPCSDSRLEQGIYNPGCWVLEDRVTC